MTPTYNNSTSEMKKQWRLAWYNEGMNKWSNPLVSVIIPVYNAERYLRGCLDSISSQEYENLEIILINDGSTDDSGKICDEFAEADERVKVIHRENAGASSARNLGMAEAAGQYIQFIDADDLVDRQLVSAMVEGCESSGADVGICRYDSFKDSLEDKVYIEPLSEIGAVEVDIISDKVLNLSSPSVWKMIFKSSFIKSNKLNFDESLVRGEDLLFGGQALVSSKKIVIVNKHLYHYRVDVASSVVSNKNPNFLTTLRALEKLKKFLEGNGLYDKFKKSFIRLAFSGALLYDYDYVTEGAFFIKKYNEIHEFASGIVYDIDKAHLDEMRNDKACLDAIWVAEIEDPALFYHQKTKQLYDRVEVMNGESLMMQDHISVLQGDIARLTSDVARLTSDAEKLDKVGPAARKLAGNIKRSLQKK